MGKAFQKKGKFNYAFLPDFRGEVKRTCFILPLLKHGDIEVRIRFHCSSLAVKTESSRGPDKKSCERRRIEDSEVSCLQ